MKVRITFWRVVFALILPAGGYGTILRFTEGLGAATGLSDAFPWGLWVGFDVLCGVGLAAGGFTMAAAVHIFGGERFGPVIRPAILTAFLGYILVILALLIDLGRPWAIWHLLVMWNPDSVLFEVAWCVMLYTAVLAVEFSPVVLERLGLRRALRWVRASLPVFVILGVLLSTLHQSSLGSLYLVLPGKLHALWYTPLLPYLFFLSALAVGCAMVVLESFLSQRAFGHMLPAPLRGDLLRYAMVMLVPYALLRVMDLVQRGAVGLAFEPTIEAALFQLEFVLGAVVPVALTAVRGIRSAPAGQAAIAGLVVLGFVLGRLNVGITGLEATLRAGYFPAWTEVAVTAMIVAIGFALFGLAARHLPIFGHVAGRGHAAPAGAVPR
ncbi:MAG: Ni/Fe-hydrogenase cytochrome b subunit [Myxococcota bacterium]|nr:Ni/Fe-hydrogenase cytochrome b subunit [Myxococcota bacterium]